jgi:hypothetical protein
MNKGSLRCVLDCERETFSAGNSADSHKLRTDVIEALMVSGISSTLLMQHVLYPRENFRVLLPWKTTSLYLLEVLENAQLGSPHDLAGALERSKDVERF